MGDCRQEAEDLRGAVRNWIDGRLLIRKLFEHDLLFSSILLSDLHMNEGGSLATPVAVSQAEMQIQALSNSRYGTLKWCVLKAKTLETKNNPLITQM